MSIQITQMIVAERMYADLRAQILAGTDEPEDYREVIKAFVEADSSIEKIFNNLTDLHERSVVARHELTEAEAAKKRLTQFYTIGDRFQNSIESIRWILCATTGNSVNLFSLKTGGRQGESQQIPADASFSKIPQSWFDTVFTGRGSWTKI